IGRILQDVCVGVFAHLHYPALFIRIRPDHWVAVIFHWVVAKKKIVGFLSGHRLKVAHSPHLRTRRRARDMPLLSFIPQKSTDDHSGPDLYHGELSSQTTIVPSGASR